MHRYDVKFNFQCGIMQELVQHKQQKYISVEIKCANLDAIYFYKHIL